MSATKRSLSIFLATIGMATITPPAIAQETVQQTPSGRYYELETKYLFGFTDGTDIGAEGENEIELETTAGLGMHRGAFSAVEQEIEYENVPTQFWGNEFSAHGLWNYVHNVDGLDNRNSVNVAGLSWKPKFLLIGRGPGDPFGLSISFQPEWARIDGASGMNSTSFGMETTLAVDTEVIPNMLYAAANLSYAPEVNRAPGDPSWSHASQFGASVAAAYRVAPKVTLGGEVQYYRAYDGFGFNAFNGQAFYVGPTLHVQFNPKVFLAAAWSIQVAGHSEGEPGALDLTNFTRQMANLKLGFEF